MDDIPRTTIVVTQEQRDFLDALPHGQIKIFLSALLDCALDLGKRYGNKPASAFIMAGIMELTDKPKEGG